MARKSTSMKRPRAAAPPTMHRRHVHGPSGREYIILDDLGDELSVTPSMWAAIESYEDNQMRADKAMPSTPHVIESQSALLCFDICPDSADEGCDDDDGDTSSKGHYLSERMQMLQPSSAREEASKFPSSTDSLSVSHTRTLSSGASQGRAIEVEFASEGEACLTTMKETDGRSLEPITPLASQSNECIPLASPPSQCPVDDLTRASITIDTSTERIPPCTPAEALATKVEIPHVHGTPPACHAGIALALPCSSSNDIADPPPQMPSSSPPQLDQTQTAIRSNSTQSSLHALYPPPQTTQLLVPISDPIPAPTPSEPAPTEELDAVQVLVAINDKCPSLAAWLRHEGDVEHDDSMASMFDDHASVTTTPPQSPPSCLAPDANFTKVPLQPPHVHSPFPSFELENWPPHLRRRCRMTPPSPSTRLSPDTPHESIVLWVRHTWRVHDNFALAAAEWLQAAYDRPVVAFCVLSPTLFYPGMPIESTTNENGVRSSIASMRRQLLARHIPLYGMLGPHDNTEVNIESQLRSLHPWAVVTDDGVDEPFESWHLPVPVIQMDSTCCVPWRSFLSDGGGELAKDAFESRWLTAWNRAMDDGVDTFLLPLHVESPSHRGRAHTAMQNNLPWPNLDKPSAFDLSEQAALAHVDATCVQGGATKKPALQEELHGRGVTSCLPFLRHGSLSAIHLLRTLKSTSNHVLHSRALTHCALAREYAMHVMYHQINATRSRPTLTSHTLIWNASYFARQLSVYRTLVDRISPPLSASTRGCSSDDRSTGTDERYLLPHQLEASRSPDPVWNDIMAHVRLTGYLHPVLASYWGRRLLFHWSPSPLAGLGMLEGLVVRYSIGVTPDVVVQVLLAMLHDGTTADKLSEQTAEDHPLLTQLRAVVRAPAHHSSNGLQL
ncbi:hypothetical protein H310_12130 [Aphanomyces invadans]|uniref:Photolyase/cryptochrome alpha/beta domain-containing protein n=1 Tax=Aphanomyces invadans TaxID=157072 RepID=A0A024TKH2_9STRA|nr:hypothetical protein H310_12130 [Aphanomyces invadans]ETV94116.1 hypothetical protein H310_12130 [Aphanomyces invadans]|eukprot:XP_008877319.1 hypothetical protein H310_12130 [Aphanomyces invadans]